MTQLIQAIRGMNDILPVNIEHWQWVEHCLRTLLENYGYHEIRLPVLEPTELFKRSIGEVTDIVEKEMYTFSDNNGDSLTLRPEGTAGCVRACLEHGMLHNQEQKLWYLGPMFRHERPQKGRYRQFYHCGVETFGYQGPDIDAELILLSARLWKVLGIAEDVELQLNSLGTVDSRAKYRDKVVDYFQAHFAELDADSQRRLTSNPLRILDSKNPAMTQLIQNAPSFADYLDEESKQHFAKLCDLLTAAGVSYQLNPYLVRGLDYYGKTVFEWVTTKLGTQGTVCAGGRYDGLVEQLGGKPVPAVGFAMGIERIILLLEQNSAIKIPVNRPHVYVISSGELAEKESLLLGERLRNALPTLKIVVNAGGGSFKSQFKRANKTQALVALILGEEEVTSKTISVKLLADDHSTQQSMNETELIQFLTNLVGESASGRLRIR